ncbi:MAG: hypothetical protein AAGB24_15860 [Bacteroidota bacterium]
MDNTDELNKLTDQLFGDLPLDAPQADFTTRVLSKISTSKNLSIIYEPLIPKQVFVILILLAVFFIPYLFSLDVGTDAGYFSLLMDKVAIWVSAWSINIEFSPSLGYMAIMVMVSVQTFLLKRYVERRLV